MSKTKNSHLHDVVSDEEFKEIIRVNTHVIVLFYDPDISICVNAEEILCKLKPKFNDSISFIKVNELNIKNIIDKYDIDIYPTVSLFYNSKLIENSYGYSSYELEQFCKYNSDKPKKRVHLIKSYSPKEQKSVKQRRNVNKNSNQNGQNNQNGNDEIEIEKIKEKQGCLWILFGDGYSRDLKDNLRLLMLWGVLIMLIIVLVIYVLYITMFSDIKTHYQVEPTWRDNYR